MPQKCKQSQTAKKKREGANAAFGTDATWITSPESSDYHVLDDDSDVAVINVDSNDDSTVGDAVRLRTRLVSVVELPFFIF